MSDRASRLAMATLAAATVGIAAYLVVVQLVVLGAVCEWCVANDAIVAMLAGLAGWRAFAELRAAPGPT